MPPTLEINGNGLRRWIDLAVRVADRPATVLLLVLAFYLFQDAGWIPSNNRKSVELITAHVAQVTDVFKRRDASDIALLEVLKRKIRIDAALCLALSKDDAVRKVCLEP